MIVIFKRALDPRTFAEKHPKAHVVVGHDEPDEQIDEEETGEPGYFTVLSTAQNTLGLIGECTGIGDHTTSTIRLSFARAEDAAKVCELVNATPDKSYGDDASMAFFNYDRTLYEKLRTIRDDRIAEIKAAYMRGEIVVHVSAGEPSNDNGERMPTNEAEPYEARIPLEWR